MTPQGDPYRILGVMPGASLNEIRAAYRRLAKQYHPDAAGERALARFLAIQAAYERLVDAEGRLRLPGEGRGPGAGRGAAGGRGSGAGRRPTEPWRADAARARASRDAWRARRAGAPSGGSGSGPARPGARTGAGDPERPRAGDGGQSGPGGATRPGPDRSSRRRSTSEDRGGRRGPRRATPGSTTYDEAADGTRDPAWDGGSWYGPTLGTYWTINPREYADPRKHGPEYQARARRAGQQTAARTRPTKRPDSADTDDDAARDDESWTYAGDGDAAWSSGRVSHDPGGSSAGATSATWASPSNATATDASPDRPAPAEPAEPLVPDLESLARRLGPRGLLALAHRGLRWRWLLAAVGWAPIGLAIGSLLTSVTGCAEFAASCPEPVPTLALLVQPLIPLLLVLAPPIAALAAFGTIAALAASVPLAAVLAVGTGPDGHAGAPVLGVMVATVYLVAIVGGAIALWRPSREP